jgi:hypothetical protein
MVFLRILFVSTDTGTAQIVPIRCQRQCGNVLGLNNRRSLDDARPDYHCKRTERGKLSIFLVESAIPTKKLTAARQIGVTEPAPPSKEPSKDEED